MLLHFVAYRIFSLFTKPDESIDGELNNLSDFGFKLKSSFTIPSEIWQISNDSFDETLATFDSGSIKFDKA